MIITCTSGFHNVKRMLRSLEASRALQHLWKDWKPHPMRTAWGHWVCLAWRKEGWEKASFFFFFLQLHEEGKWKRKCQSTLTGHQWQEAQNSKVAPEGFQLHMRKNIFTDKVVKHKQASQGLMPHACLCSRGIWTMPSVTCFPSKQTALFCVLFR